VDLGKVINTGKFDFEEAEANSKWLSEGRYDFTKETEEYGVSSFLFKRNRPFHPERLHALLDKHFMLDIVNPDDEDGHGHGHDHGGDWEDADDDEEDETDEQYEARLAIAKDKLKNERREAFHR